VTIDSIKLSLKNISKNLIYIYIYIYIYIKREIDIDRERERVTGFE